MNLKRTMLTSTMIVLSSSVTLAGAAEVFKTVGCGCCEVWIDQARGHYLEPVVRDVDIGEMARVKAEAGISPDLASCHTTLTGGYVIEGHVQGEDIARLLAERPEAIGLAAPGMPAGSPGMEGAGAEPYSVLLLFDDGGKTVYATH
jgi:hypothetical protein